MIGADLGPRRRRRLGPAASGEQEKPDEWSPRLILGSIPHRPKLGVGQHTGAGAILIGSLRELPETRRPVVLGIERVGVQDTSNYRQRAVSGCWPLLLPDVAHERFDVRPPNVGDLPTPELGEDQPL